MKKKDAKEEIISMLPRSKGNDFGFEKRILTRWQDEESRHGRQRKGQKTKLLMSVQNSKVFVSVT